MIVYANTTNPYFISDTHFFSKKMIGFQQRGINGVLFKDEIEMTAEMINIWNSIIKKEDEVFFIGDLANYNEKHISYVLNHLNGNIRFILGNHDLYSQYSKLDIEVLPAIVNLRVYDTDLDRFKENGKKVKGYNEIVLCHYPILSWDKKMYGNWHLHGHTHGLMNNNPIIKELFYSCKVLDVSVDTNGLKPYSYLDIKKIMETKVIKNNSC